jgi:hypothetical protein
MLKNLLYATKDLLSDIANAVVVYAEQVKYTVQDQFSKNDYNVDTVSFEEEVVPKKKRKKKKK